MANVSVIIPFYQIEQGIIRRSITSIINQNSKHNITIIVVDDGSPAKISKDIFDIEFPKNIVLNIIKKENGGVSSARNAGLNNVNNDCDFIAFLDSDDVWDSDHLQTALLALGRESDLYFSDNERPGFHQSYFQEICPELIALSKISENEIIHIEKNNYIDLLIRKFPSQISTVVARWCDIKDIRFEERFRMAGEDMIYIMLIAIKSRDICFTRKRGAVCGRGLNLYFSTMDWQSPQHIPRLIDELQLYNYIKKMPETSLKNRSWAKTMINSTRRDITYFVIRAFLKLKKAISVKYFNALLSDKLFFALLTINIPISIYGIITKTYRTR